MRSHEHVVLGHEFVGEIADYGPKTHRRWKSGKRIVVVGVCMKRDHFFPVNAINKEIDLRFTLGYMPIEFRDALHMIAEGKVKVDPMITGTVELSGVDEAFAALGNPEQHAKILIDPSQR